MPNEFDTNKNQLDLFNHYESEASKANEGRQDKRQKLASSGFTATIWTLSGVVLAACSIFDDDGDGLGGNAVHVNASPVQGARVYFDINGDGQVNEDDVRIQNEQYPQGFITGADGRAVGIPAELFGRPYIALLDGAEDATTGQTLEGQYSSLADADGNHLIASPITDLIKERATGGTSVEDVVEEFLGQGGTPPAEDVEALLEELRSPESYLPGDESSPRVIALAKYLAHNQAKEVVGREDAIAAQVTEAQRIIAEVESGVGGSDAIVILNEDTDSNTAGVQVEIEIGAHDSYVGIINAFSQDGSTLSYTLIGSADGATPYSGVYTINDRGGIEVAEGNAAADETFWVEVSNGIDADSQVVEVQVTLDGTVDELSLAEEFSVGDIEENMLGSTADPLIAGIEVVGSTPAPADFTIRDGFLNVFADKFEMMEDTINGGWNVRLKDDQWLDYEAIPDGTFDLYVSVANNNGHHSNILTVTITVSDIDDISFGGQTRGDLIEDENVETRLTDPNDETSAPINELIARGQVEIANQVDLNGVRAQVVLSSGSVQPTGDAATVQTLTLTYGTFVYNHETNEWTYTVNNDDAAVDALLDDEAKTEIVDLTITDPTNMLITYTQSIVLNINGANEDVRFVDGDGNRITSGVSAEGIEIGLDATSGVELGDVVPEIRGLLASNDDSNVVLADDMGGLFSLDSATGILTFTGTAAQIADLGGSADLELVLTAPASIGDEEVRFNLRVNVVNENDDAPAEFEITGDTSAVGNELVAVLTDADGIASISYQWYRGDDPATRIAIGSNQATYIVTADDVEQTLTVDITYTDASAEHRTAGGSTVTAATTPVEFTSPNLVEPDENNANWEFQVTATSEDSDSDGSDSDIASYEILDVRDENGDVVPSDGIFSMSNAGLITISRAFDRETDGAFFTLRVRATDTVESAVPGDEADSGTQTITVRIGDVNDNLPVFDESAYAASIDETLAPGAPVISVRATDADGTADNSNVIYSITAGNTGDVFHINESTGEITVAAGAELDFETTPSYTLTIGARDGLDASGTDDTVVDTTTTVTITINDINDESPSVPNHEATGTARITAAVDNPSGTGMGYTVTVSDADADATTLDVSVTSGDPRFEFRRQGSTNTWELYLAAGQELALSELGNQLTFEYTVTDGGVGTSPVIDTFILTVVDTPVEFTAPADTTIPLDENNAANLAVTTVTATSSDDAGDPVFIKSFALVDAAGDPITGGIFEITTSGLSTASAAASITIADANALNFEATESYTLRVLATDTNDETNTIMLTINVGNLEEGDAAYAIELTDTNGDVITELAEGTTLTPMVTMADPDNIDPNSISYQWFRLVNGSKVLIDEADGGIGATYTIPSGADTSVPYGVEITYTDGANNTETVEALTSSVSFDAGRGNQEASVTEGAVTTANLAVIIAATSVTDGGPDIRYAITGGDPGGLFALGTDNNGNDILTFASTTTAVSHEATDDGIYQIEITATEDATTGTGDTAMATITVRIGDVEEGPATYIVKGTVEMGETLTAELAPSGEDADGRVGDAVYRWYTRSSTDSDPTTLTDAETATFNWLGAASTTNTYSIVGAPQTGVVYGVAVRYLDGYADGQSPVGPQTVVTALASSLRFSQEAGYTGTIKEDGNDLTSGLAVSADLVAGTPDITYQFVDGSGNAVGTTYLGFTIGSANGAITFDSTTANTNLNFEDRADDPQIVLTVRATHDNGDNSIPNPTGDTTVTITVSDVNEVAPVFATTADDTSLADTTIAVAENAANGDRVGLFRATDADGTNNVVSYSLEDGGIGAFGIRAVDGTNNWEIYVLDASILDYDSASKSYSLEITASDSDPDTTTRKSTMETFTINLTDVNDRDPVATTAGGTTASITEATAGVAGGTATGFSVTLSDEDTDTVNMHNVEVIGTHESRFGFVKDGTTPNQWNLVLLEGQTVDREDTNYVTIDQFRQGRLTVEYQITDSTQVGIRYTSPSNSVGILVNDVNEHKPVLGDPVWASTYETDGVREGVVPPGAIFEIAATDRDENNGFIYEIVSIDSVAHGDITNPLFVINPTNGEVGILRALDFETAQSHEIVIQAVDENGNGMTSDPKTVIVNVGNEDDGPATYAITGETVNDGSLTVAVDTADPDGLATGTESYRWFILNSDGSIPAAGDTNGNIGNAATFDLPSDVGTNVYGVVVTYEDVSGKTETVTVVASPLRFASSAVEGRIAENSAETIEIATVTAELSTNTAAVPSYTITDASGKFEISTSGVITLKSGQTLDFEAAPDLQDGSGNKGYVVTVDAETTDAGKTENAPPATVTIIVIDENDNDPTLDMTHIAGSPNTEVTEFTIDENEVGAQTLAFMADDKDTVFSGSQTALGFIIAAVDSTNQAAVDLAAKFEIVYNPGTNFGRLRLKAGESINREDAGLNSDGELELHIQATDGRTTTGLPKMNPVAGDGLSAVRTVTIAVDDLNDETPTFTNGATHSETISESANAGVTVVSANPATDGDATAARQSLTYSIIGSDHGFFTLDTSTGQITLTKPFDFETTPDLTDGSGNKGYVIVLQADAGDGFMARQEITVVVEDANEPPVLGVTQATGTITETTASGIGARTGIILTLTDPDVADVGLDAGDFTLSDTRFGVVDNGNGNWEVVLRSGQTVNYETAADRSINLVISVEDEGGLVSAAHSDTITVTVENANDEEPTLNDPQIVWQSGFAGGIIDEDTDGSTTRVLIATIAVNDPDGTDYAAGRRFTLNAADVNVGRDAIRKFRVENDGAGNANLYLTDSLNSESTDPNDRNVYENLRIDIDDGPDSISTNPFTITIADVNEADPAVAMATSASIDEQTAPARQQIATFTVTDADTLKAYELGDIDFTATDRGNTNVKGRFEITFNQNTKEGAVWLKSGQTLNYENSDERQISIIVTATDVDKPGGVASSGSATLTLTVNDVDDTDPEFGNLTWVAGTGTQGARTRTIDENINVDTLLLGIALIDVDTVGANREVEIKGGSSIFTFVKDANGVNGRLSVNANALNYEDATSHTLTLVLKDNTNADAEITITINVADLNDNGPIWNSGDASFAATISESALNNSVVTTVTASDADSSANDNNKITYAFVVGGGISQTDQGFAINADSGQITVADTSLVNYDTQTAHTLRVRATNIGQPPIERDVVVTLNDENDQTPVLEAGNITWDTSASGVDAVDATTISVQERHTDGTSGVAAGTVLATLNARDTDTVGTVSYRIDTHPQIGGANVFRISGNQLILNTALNFEDGDIVDLGSGLKGYRITLVADDGVNAEDSVEVTIQVVNIDEGQAEFADITTNRAAGDGGLTSPIVGDVLTFNPTQTTSDGDGDPQSGYTPTWYREDPDGTNRVIISGTSGNTYTLTEDDIGKRVGAIVTYTDGSGITYDSTDNTGPNSIEVGGVTGAVAADFTVTGGATGAADQYDASAVDDTGTLTFSPESAADVETAGTYTIVSQGTYGTATVDGGVWTYNVNNDHATIKGLDAGETQTDTFTIGVPLTAAAGGGVQNVDVTVTITGRTDSQVQGSVNADTGRAGDSPANPLDRVASTDFEVIQGGNGNDEIYVGSGGSIVIGGYGSDTIHLGDGADTVIYRFTSIDQTAGWRATDGGDTINNFELGKDRIIFVDTDDASVVDLDTYLDRTGDDGSKVEGKTQALLKFVGATIGGLGVRIPDESDDNGPADPDDPSTTGGNITGTEISVLWSETFSRADGIGRFFGSGGAGLQSTELTDYETYFTAYFGTSNDFTGIEIYGIDDLDIDIL